MTQLDPTRERLLDALAQLSAIFPEWRMGQTLAILAMQAGRVEASGVWNLEDDEAIDTILDLVEKHRDRVPHPNAMPSLAR